jgi:purine nucleosidase
MGMDPAGQRVTDMGYTSVTAHAARAPAWRRALRFGRGAAVAALVAATAVVGTSAIPVPIPVPIWGTGDQGLAQMTFARESTAFAGRLWIDTDAACGHGTRTDPDDCFAIALLARAMGDRIAGISTVAGNAPLEVVETTTRELAARLSAELGRTLRVHTGSQGLTAALEEGQLTVVALGPLTNLAKALDLRPDLRSRVTRVIAVMGRRPGHLFHPAEGSGRGTLFGHGPIFRDFNFEMDVDAAKRIVALGVPLTLVPYDAARRVEISAADLDRLAAAGGAAAWIAERSRGWLAYWQRDIGRQGFSPFDLLAAAYVVEPRHFGCADVQAWVGEDTTIFVLLRRPAALLVRQRAARPEKPVTLGVARYCADVPVGIMPWLVERLAG